MVRTGAEALTVSGVFEPGGKGWRGVLEEAGLDAEGEEVLVRREIGRSGRNRVFVNDQPTTLRLLADLAPFLLRIHGQRDELGLVEPDLQRAMLDRSGGAEAGPLLARVAAAFDLYTRLAERLERLSGDDRMRRERLDLLRFQAGEIDAARVRAGEEVELRAERDVLRNAETIARALGTAATLLFDEEGAAVERVARAEYRDAALSLSQAREAWGRALVERIEGELKDLGLARARLAVALERRRRTASPLVLENEEVDFGRDGVDQVVFLFAPNPGEPPRPLARIASGGEAEKANPTLVFDEVDSGIGGAEAAALGAKLQRLAGGGRILAGPQHAR